MPFQFTHSYLPEFKRICSQFSSCSFWFCYSSPQGPARDNRLPGALPWSEKPTRSQEQTSPFHQEQGAVEGDPQSHREDAAVRPCGLPSLREAAISKGFRKLKKRQALDFPRAAAEVSTLPALLDRNHGQP